MASRLAWTIVVPFCVVLAIVAVVVIVRENTGSTDIADAAAESPTVVMEKLSFSPGTLTVPRGAEVLFDNNDVAPHTVTADEGATDSGVIDPGKAFTLVVNEPLSYHCAIHPSMTAEIRLEG
jgi:plastocyanin